MAWKDLSIAQRSQLMNLYRRSGITDLASMRENYDIFSSQENTDPYLQYEHSPWFAGGGNKKKITVPEAPVDLDYEELKRRQRYAESTFNNAAQSQAGAKGAFQIMPGTLQEYIDSTGDVGDIFDLDYNTKVRDWYMNKLTNSRTISNGNPTPEVMYAKQLAAYNWGVGNLGNYLQKQKDAGMDIYNTLDWVAGLPAEPRDYINFILLNKDVNEHKSNAAYQEALKSLKASGGPIHIKPSRRGTFTAAATKHGMGVQEFATHVLANKDDYSSKMIKKAVFAKNFGKKSYGGIKF